MEINVFVDIIELKHVIEFCCIVSINNFTYSSNNVDVFEL